MYVQCEIINVVNWKQALALDNLIYSVPDVVSLDQVCDL